MKKNYVVNQENTVKSVIQQMEHEVIKAVVVEDDNNRVVGLFSNGDMRSFFLRGGALSEKVSVAMNKNPKLFYSQTEVEEQRRRQKLVIYPIVDDNKQVIMIIDDANENDGEQISDVLEKVPLVIMAGGKGTRLYPYTKILPKPLIPIGDVTITERIIASFQRYGCKHVMMILNHKANMIKAYMQELDKTFDVDFVQESKFLGTAGGLRLLKDKIHDTFFLSNCDILINADLECIYKTHKANGNKITFVCSMKDITIPYGVVQTDQAGLITKITEKPEFSFLINTGLYMIEADVLNDIEADEFIHLPDLAQRYLDKGEKVGVFPISEEAWLDMGQFKEMENMMKSLGL